MIEFSNPAALWLLTLAAPLILLYLLKRRRQDLTVASLMLWKRALEDMRAHRPFQRLRSQLLLYLQLLILVMITAILSGPHLVESSRPSRRWVLVMDVSASMQATDEKPDRFGAAREKLLQALDQAPADDEVLLLSLGAEASVVQPFTGSHNRVRQKLLELQPEDTAGNWEQLAHILEPLMKDRPLPRVIIASDFANFPAELGSKLSLDALRVGVTGDNVAITRVAAEPVLENPDTQQLFYQIRNDFSARRTVDVELLAEDRVLDAYSVEIEGSGALERTAELTVLAPTTITLKLEPADALPLDNDFVLFVTPRPRRRIASTYANPFLLKALGALPAVELAADGPIRIENTSEELQTSPGIYFLTPQPGSPAGRVVQWNSAHPALRFVDAGLWKFAKYSVLNPPPDATILMETSRGPVAYASKSQQGRRLILGFKLEDSNLYQLAGFPVFLQNATRWIEEDLQKPVPALTGPSIRKEGKFQDSSGISGFANFADAGESRILPGRSSGMSAPETWQVARKQDVSRWFLILAVSIVILEWWAFHRRMEL